MFEMPLRMRDWSSLVFADDLMIRLFVWVYGISTFVGYLMPNPFFIHINIFYFKQFSLPDFGMMVRVFTNGPGDQGSIPGRVIPKTQKMVLDASLISIQHYKVKIKGKVGQSKERSSALPYTLV